MRLGRCLSVLYDTVTVLISIADVVTDVVVLLSFYEQERTVFFVISLVTLCLAQCAYVTAFIWRYDAFESITSGLVILCFPLLLLPFGPLIPIVMFLTNDGKGCFADFFEKLTGFYPRNDLLSNVERTSVKWLMQKLDKVQIDFLILQNYLLYSPVTHQRTAHWFHNRGRRRRCASLICISTSSAKYKRVNHTAFPQSLLQMCAIVYYKEASAVSIVSILLSMVSVMTKSLVFSKGIEMRTFVWTWFWYVCLHF